MCGGGAAGDGGGGCQLTTKPNHIGKSTSIYILLFVYVCFFIKSEISSNEKNRTHPSW